MIEGAPLALVESFGKRAPLSQALSEYAGERVTVLATGGHLVNLPDDSCGVRGGDYAVTAWRPCRETYEFLAGCIRQAGELWLWTDDDDEGEWIAAQCATLARATNSVRYRTCGFDQESIADAIARPGEIDDERVRRAVARRVYNRIVGRGARQRHPAAHVGPVTAPLLEDIAARPLLPGTVAAGVVAADGTRWEMRSAPTSFQHVSDCLPDRTPRPEGATTRESGDARRPDSPALLGDLAAATGKPVHEIALLLQEDYVAGRVSYPRTLAGGLTQLDCVRLRGVVLQAGQRPPDELPMADDEPGAHSALIPLCTSGHMTDWLLGRWLDSGGGNVIEAEDPRLPGIRLSRPAEDVEAHPVGRAWRGPGLVKAPRTADAEMERAVFERMVGLGLGTPATLPQHALHVRNTHLDRYGGLSKLGALALRTARAMCPALSRIGHARRAEERLSRGTHAERVAGALDAVGYRPSGLEARTTPTGPMPTRG